MSKEARKSIRRVIRHAGAILSDGSILSKCTVLDVSSSGAKIALQTPIEVPEKFILLMSKGGKVRRQCQVVRRSETEIGVQFVS
jgi:PilZ domain-containing protein